MLRFLLLNKKFNFESQFILNEKKEIYPWIIFFLLYLFFKMLDLFINISQYDFNKLLKHVWA